MSTSHLQLTINEVGKMLASKQNPEGYWEGHLSSSALGVAVSLAALHFFDAKNNAKEIRRGIEWLQKSINADGSYGDTPESPGNVSTSLLVYAALNLYGRDENSIQNTQSRIANYLSSLKIDVNSPQVVGYILAHYRRDYTFSVPILSMCGLCGVPGEDAFEHIPQLPFELSLLPKRFYRLLNLSVVSYAIPALVAVGILIYKKKKSNLFWRILRKFSVKKAMAILHRMMPESGGFLEAIPLTAFVSLSLINSGFSDTKVVQKGIQFLKKTQREDGSWPIDVDLSTWVTSLSVKSYRKKLNHFFTTDVQNKIADHFKRIQNSGIHPFNGAGPGGWGWTSYSGSVPDGDDTPGAILAILKLQPKEKVKKQVLAAAKWLGQLQNNDGGFPTFSKGWGKLPFDKSCSDLTGHCTLAVSEVLESYPELNEKEAKVLRAVYYRAVAYLEKEQNNDGSWLPLWFGNQLVENHVNPVYGTARVLTYLKDAVVHNWYPLDFRHKLEKMIGKGNDFLVSMQNSDGSWGGSKNIPGTIEETSLAISALISENNISICNDGVKWLGNYIQNNGFKSAPIGLYFASLWYDEILYPVIFYMECLSRMDEYLTKDKNLSF